MSLLGGYATPNAHNWPCAPPLMWIRLFCELQSLEMNRIDYNSALDLTRRQKFRFIDATEKAWTVKIERKWM
jgi:hypothetical protein